MTATTATAPTTSEAAWFEAVAARDAHDEQVKSYWSRTQCGEHAAQPVRRSQAAKRAHLTRAIIRAEKAIEAEKAAQASGHVVHRTEQGAACTCGKTFTGPVGLAHANARRHAQASNR